MAKPLFLLQSHKFSSDNIETTLVCPYATRHLGKNSR